MAKETTLTLNNGTKMPVFGLGTYCSDPWEVQTAVEAALKDGYRSIDCAHIYENEFGIGEALQKCFKEGVVKREDIFVTSKLWNTDHGRDDVLSGCETTLKNLQLDYLDLYLIHWPTQLKKDCLLYKLEDNDKMGYDAQRMAKCWEGMEELVSKGLVKAIGISNFSITKTDRLLQTAKIVPAVNQVECHPYLQQPKLKEYLDSKGIVLEAYSPLGNPGSPFRTGTEPQVLEDPVIMKVAVKHKATAAQVCIAFALHRGLPVIPKSVTPSRITENLKATELKLDAEDMQQLVELNRDYRFVDGDFWMLQGQSADEYLWDVEEDKKFVVTSK